jgi:hypothetical protein
MAVRSLPGSGLLYHRLLPAAPFRVFYTGVGHRTENFLGGPGRPRFPRRQLYNAFLWKAKYDSLSQAALGIPRQRPADAAATEYRVEALPSALKVTLLQGGNHALELMGIDGRRVARREGRGTAGSGQEPRGAEFRPFRQVGWGDTNAPASASKGTEGVLRTSIQHHSRG